MEGKEKQATGNCRFLRAKDPYGGMDDGAGGMFFLDESNSICWCVKSQGPVGPDGSFVALDACVSGRRCFESRS
jgi:hypothetical protein